MSRRHPPSKAVVPRRKKTKVPVILYLLWPLWGPVVLWVKAERKKRKKAQMVTKKDLLDIGRALRTGKTDQLVDLTEQVKAQRWHYQNRQVMYALEVAVALAVSKVALFGPSLLPLLGMLIFGVVFLAGAPWWLVRVSRNPLPELKKKILDHVPARWPLKLRAALARLLSPAFGAGLVVVIALWWWASPLERPRAILIWFVTTVVVLGVRAWRFRVRALEVASTGTREGDWEEYIAGKVATAKDSVLQGTDDFLNDAGARLGWSGGVLLPKGSKGATAVAPDLRGPIATTYQVGREDVMIERFQGADGRFDESRFVVTVLDEPGSNAIYVVHTYDGSDFDPVVGTWTQAIRADWKPAVGQLYKPGHGGFSLHFSGETGGGKSEGMETMIRSITARGTVAPWIIDIGAASFGDWRNKVEIFVDQPEDVLQLLVNHGALVEHRKRKLGTMRLIKNGRDVGQLRVYPIDREHPCIPGIFDEWSFFVGGQSGQPVLKATENVVTQQRKVDAPLILAGQATSLQSGFGNNNNVRTQFQAGGMIAFKNNAESGRQAFGKNIQVDPSTIPLECKGACFMTSNADARDAMARGRWVEEPSTWDHQIDIPEMPRDEVDILTRGLSFRPFQVQVPELPGQRPEPEPAAPTLQLVQPEPEKSTLAQEVAEWVIQQEKPVQRQDVVKEFRNNRTRAGSRAIDNALKEAKDGGVLVADEKGFYTSAKVGAA